MTVGAWVFVRAIAVLLALGVFLWVIQWLGARLVDRVIARIRGGRWSTL